jgi:hypothetical protein
MNREEKVNVALEAYNFGAEVLEVEAWNIDGDVWSCAVYLKTEEEESQPMSFTVWFYPETDNVKKVSSDFFSLA